MPRASRGQARAAMERRRALARGVPLTRPQRGAASGPEARAKQPGALGQPISGIQESRRSLPEPSTARIWIGGRPLPSCLRWRNLTMRRNYFLVLVAALSFAACSSDTFSTSNQPDASGGSGGAAASGAGGSASAGASGNGTGGLSGVGGAGAVSGSNGNGGTSGSSSGGSGGSSGTSDAGQDSGNLCPPMPGCTSRTSCNDGCNTCVCANGQWACTARACPPEDAGRADAGQGACETDLDCIFRPASGCCGMCLAKQDPIPPPIPCGAACSAVPPACVCINGKCGTGTTPIGGACDRAHNLCAHGLLCCSQCGGPVLPDAQNCTPPVCTQPVFISGTPNCPLPLP
jgi:hypothetical protein